MAADLAADQRMTAVIDLRSATLVRFVTQRLLGDREIERAAAAIAATAPPSYVTGHRG